MTAPTPLLIRPRSATELIDATFALLRGHYLRLVALAGLALLPYVVLSLRQTIRWGMDPGGVIFFEQVLVYFVCSGVAHAAIAVAISQLYHGRPLDTAEALRRTMRRLWLVIATSVVALSLIAVGFLFFFVPAVLLFTQYFAIPTVVVLEDAGFRESFRRSGALSRGRRKLILSSYGLTWLVATVITAAIELLVGGGFTTIERPVLVSLVSDVASILTFPVIATVATLAYYETRIRAEAYDLEVLAASTAGVERIGTAPGSSS